MAAGPGWGDPGRGDPAWRNPGWEVPIWGDLCRGDLYRRCPGRGEPAWGEPGWEVPIREDPGRQGPPAALASSVPWRRAVRMVRRGAAACPAKVRDGERAGGGEERVTSEPPLPASPRSPLRPAPRSTVLRKVPGSGRLDAGPPLAAPRGESGARLRLPAPCGRSDAALPADGSSCRGGGTPVCVRPVPAWQRRIGEFRQLPQKENRAPGGEEAGSSGVAPAAKSRCGAWGGLGSASACPQPTP